MLIPPSELSIDAYHSSAPQWLSKSSILDFKKHGPQWWNMRYLLGIIPKDEPTDAMEQGNALDCMLTEPEGAFYAKYVIKPQGMNFSTKEGKAWKEKNEGKEIIKGDDYKILLEAVEAVKMNPIWPLIDSSKKQCTLRRQTNLGFGFQSRPDFIAGNIYIDLKKTYNLETFGRDAINFGYHYQASLADFCAADDGLRFEKYLLVACEWDRGSRCRVFEIPQMAIDAARIELVTISQEISDRLKSGNWEDIQSEPQPLEIPAYLARKLES
jgi:hypothetical protein